jgi:hypothetical protein
MSPVSAQLPIKLAWRCLGCGASGAVELPPGTHEDDQISGILNEHRQKSPCCRRPDVRLVQPLGGDR